MVMQLPFNLGDRHESLDNEIDRVLTEMNSATPGTQEYTNLMTHLERLNNVKQKNKLPRVSRDTWVQAGVSLFLGLAMLNFERTGVLTSKMKDYVPGFKNKS
jgi:hypothetical protein